MFLIFFLGCRRNDKIKSAYDYCRPKVGVKSGNGEFRSEANDQPNQKYVDYQGKQAQCDKYKGAEN